MPEQVTIWNLMMLLPPLINALGDAWKKAKATDPKTLKPSYKSTTFWFSVIAALAGAIGTVTTGGN